MLIRNTFVLVKTEGSSYGVDAAPTATNAVRVRSIEVKPLTGTRIERNLLRGFGGAGGRTLLTQQHVGLTIELELSGSGTAGTAPRWGPLLASGCTAATTTSSAVTGTAQAGSAGSITLASGASATDDFYAGMPISITSGTGNGHRGVIVSYSGTTKVAAVAAYTAAFTPGSSSGYSIAANVQYRPITTVDGVADTSCTIWAVKDKNVHKMTGCRLQPVLSGELGDVSILKLEGIGLYSVPVASTGITATFGAQADATPVETGTTSALSFMGVGPCLQSWELNLGVSAMYRSLVGCTEKVHAERAAATGQVMIEAPEVATTSWYAKALDNTGASDAPFTLQQGGTAGNIVTIHCRSVQINDDMEPGDTDGVEMLTVPFMALPSDSGNDEFRITVA